MSALTRIMILPVGTNERNNEWRYIYGAEYKPLATSSCEKRYNKRFFTYSYALLSLHYQA